MRKIIGSSMILFSLLFLPASLWAIVMEEYSVATISIIVFFIPILVGGLKLKGKPKKIENFVNQQHPDVTVPPTKNQIITHLQKQQPPMTKKRTLCALPFVVTIDTRSKYHLRISPNIKRTRNNNNRNRSHIL